MNDSVRWLLVAAAAILGAACTSASESEIQQWMAEVRQTMKPRVEPVPAPKEFTPHVYEARSLIDPFDPQKIVIAVARQQQARTTASAIKPDLERRREILESFPLDQIRMVGMMRQNGVNVALLETNGMTHLVRVGNYVGQNFGLVTRITETEVHLKEIVQDAAGEWVERPAKLELQEAAAQRTAQGQGRKQ
ncbi:MAG: pilus assembly protein PilP [Sutterellaceae bacterium]|nr:pilus assembly protein PilP [Burkholderiaceae bacterium]MCX7901393.1 pilus assembly protein PilP [Burkholderiaceae bacterium]MDW8430113.1 pilus assembly protein PilP [Sutterellaceae bacterium]